MEASENNLETNGVASVKQPYLENVHNHYCISLYSTKNNVKYNICSTYASNK